MRRSWMNQVNESRLLVQTNQRKVNLYSHFVICFLFLCLVLKHIGLMLISIFLYRICRLCILNCIDGEHDEWLKSPSKCTYMQQYCVYLRNVTKTVAQRQQIIVIIAIIVIMENWCQLRLMLFYASFMGAVDWKNR